MSTLRVTFLGSGDAFSAGGSHQAAYLVAGPETTSLLDCGATTLGAMKKLGLEADRIDRILISHLHGDHFAGLPFLFLEYLYETQRRRPLQIVGPPGTEERVWELFRAMYRETASRPLSFETRFIEVSPDRPVELGPLHIEPFRVPHQDNEICLGYRIHQNGKSILYSGDTGWTEDLVRYAEGTDLFICECCYFDTRTTTHLDYRRIEMESHRFHTGRLVLTHLGREVLEHREQIHLTLAHDGLILDL